MTKPKSDDSSHVKREIKRSAKPRFAGTIGDITFSSDANSLLSEGMKLRQYVGALIKETHEFQARYNALTKGLPPVEMEIIPGETMTISHLDDVFKKVNSTLNQLQDLCRKPASKANKEAFQSALKNLLWDGLNSEGNSGIKRTGYTPVGLRAVTQSVYEVVVEHSMLQDSDKPDAAEFVKKVEALNQRYNGRDGYYVCTLVRDIESVLKHQPQKER